MAVSEWWTWNGGSDRPSSSVFELSLHRKWPFELEGVDGGTLNLYAGPGGWVDVGSIE